LRRPPAEETRQVGVDDLLDRLPLRSGVDVEGGVVARPPLVQRQAGSVDSAEGWGSVTCTAKLRFTRRNSRTQDGAHRVLPHFKQAVADVLFAVPQASQILRVAVRFFEAVLAAFVDALVRFVAMELG
jgi:hypothetical protein